MKLFLHILAFLCIGAHCALAAAPDDNITAESVKDVYKIKVANDGGLGHVKEKKEITFLANRVDDEAIAMAFYNDDIAIDKASAPGSKPQYRKATDSDIFFDDSRICYMSVPIKAGKQAKASFEITRTNPAQFCQISLTPAYFTKVYSVEVEVPAPLAATIKVEPYNLPPDAEINKHTLPDGSVLHSVTLRNVAIPKSEPLAPSYEYTAPRLIVHGHFKDLAQLYARLHSYCPKTDSAEPSVAELATSLSAKAPNTLAAIDSIAGWVRRNIRYVAIEHGDYAHRPEAAATVLEKRYGDCKGSANLIRNMLRACGIDGRLVWIGTAGAKPYGWSDYPVLSAGNHMIAAAVLPDTIIYLDGTTGMQPAGYLAPAIQGREALIEDGDSYMLRTTPSLPAETSADSAFIRSRIAGAALLSDVSRTYTGFKCYALENALADISASKRPALLEAAMAPLNPAARVDSIRRERSATDAPSTLITYAVAAPNAVKTASGAQYISFPAFHSLPAKPVDTQGRTSGVRLPTPTLTVTESILQLPEGTADVNLPPNSTFSNPWFEGEITFRMAGDNTIECKSRIKTLRTTATLSELEQWNAALKEIEKAASSKIKIIK